jgi:2-polyprenyl-3-methyl-5-hydroxy-6-metoxy-1,4-benzoquinol methylase
MTDVVLAYFKDVSNKSVIDIATGDQHPGMFIFKSIGFDRVVGTDIISSEKIKYIPFICGNMEYIKDDILNSKIEEKFDCVSCISALEHFRPEQQEIVMNSLIGKVKEKGCILMTFDMPGYEYMANIKMYQDVLSKNSFTFINEEVNSEDIIRTTNSLCASQNLRKMNLSCYRLFAWR